MTKETVRRARWDDVKLEQLTPTITRRIVTGEKAMTGLIELKKGSFVPKHSHESEQITIVLEGALRFVIDGRTIDVTAGESLVIPSWVEHEATALEDTRELDVFSPIRRDWLDGTDTYFKAGVGKSGTNG
jgi:quercetin dioxygenase-like cupin family protein